MTKKHKLYLERLRRSGRTNMFGAAPYLANYFNIDKYEARKILSEWMQTYDPEDPDYKELAND